MEGPLDRGIEAFRKNLNRLNIIAMLREKGAAEHRIAQRIISGEITPEDRANYRKAENKRLSLPLPHETDDVRAHQIGEVARITAMPDDAVDAVLRQNALKKLQPPQQ